MLYKASPSEEKNHDHLKHETALPIREDIPAGLQLLEIQLCLVN